MGPSSDVSAWTYSWPWTVLKNRNRILGLVLGVEDQVLGLGLGHVTYVLVLVLVLATQDLNLCLPLNFYCFK